MTRARRLFTFVVVALAPAGIACSSTTDPTAAQALTAREAQSVASALFAQIFAALGGPAGFTQNTTQPGALLFSRAVSPTNAFSGTCRLGGTVSGTYTESSTLDADGTGMIAVTSTYAPNACVVSTGSRHVTVNGAPSLTMSLVMPLVRYVPSGTATVQRGGG